MTDMNAGDRPTDDTHEFSPALSVTLLAEGVALGQSRAVSLREPDLQVLRDCVRAYASAARTASTPPEQMIGTLKRQMRRASFLFEDSAAYSLVSGWTVDWAIKEYYDESGAPC